MTVTVAENRTGSASAPHRMDVTTARRSASPSSLEATSRSMQLSPSFTLVPTGLQVVGLPSLEEWTHVGQDLFRLANTSTWAIGDWLVHGEGRGDWGEMYAQAIDLTQKSYDTLVQCARVSKAFEPVARYRNLSWSHHQAVVSLEPDERGAILQHAEGQQWTRDDVCEHVRSLRATPTAPRHACPKCGWRW